MLAAVEAVLGKAQVEQVVLAAVVQVAMQAMSPEQLGKELRELLTRGEVEGVLPITPPHLDQAAPVS